jgi:hypothetical protein
MKKNILFFTTAVFVLFAASCSAPAKKETVFPEEVTISIEVLKDKIKGGWAGQTIGCTYGGPTEFKYRGAIIHDYQNMIWYDDYIYETFIEDPGLYDDVYMDLTFVEVIERLGLNAPVDSFAVAFANADYKLWHANQAARYNILNGIMPPASGHWRNNPHADDIDFQIEADFIGMMTPGMVNTGSAYCDRIGHIMNYGDGWYGGVFVSAMYSLAFISDDIPFVINEALKTIPSQSRFHKSISDVIKWHKQYPNDWKQCWFEFEKVHASEKGCPEGVFNAFNIDAGLNSAYVVIGLLYGEKDFFKTMDISTRCGQDSDCNPATAAGILGVMGGYSSIPDFWKPALEKVEDLDFPYTSISLNRIYDLSLEHALELVNLNGGKSDANSVTIKTQKPAEVRFEESFTGLYPKERRPFNKDLYDENIVVNFDGTGVVVMGAVKRIAGNDNDYVAIMEASLNGEVIETFNMPFDYIKRKYDIFHLYELLKKEHKLTIVWKNPHPDFRIHNKDVVIYSNEELKPFNPTIQ